MRFLSEMLGYAGNVWPSKRCATLVRVVIKRGRLFISIYIIKGACDGLAGWLAGCGGGSTFRRTSTFCVDFYVLTYGLWRFGLGPGMVTNRTIR